MREPHSPGPKARIIIHDEGAGVPSPDVVTQRARELAVIAGRAANDYTDEDIRQAKLELVQDDETGVGEELIREGMDEALHDEMLEARKRNIREGS
jgi:hypothetical protein